MWGALGPAPALTPAASLAQLLLATLHLFLLVAQSVVPFRSWALWARVTLERDLEAVVAAAMMGSAGPLVHEQPPQPPVVARVLSSQC